MVTLTYGDVPDLDCVSDDLEHFWRRFRRATGERPGPYAAVPEWGKRTRRLHLHVGVTWWERLAAVEVCRGCAREALLAKRSDVAPRGSLCIGCVWGHGFVGRPECNADGKGLPGYLSKYLAKDLRSAVGGSPFGRQSYRVAQGFQPECERFDVASYDEGRAVALDVVGGGSEPVSEWSSEEEPEWSAPPVWTMDWVS